MVDDIPVVPPGVVVVMTNVVCASVPVPVETIVAVVTPVETTVAAVDGVIHAITDTVTFCAGRPSFVVKVRVTLLPAGKGVTGKSTTLFPLVEVIGGTTRLPSGRVIVTVIVSTLVFLVGPVTLPMIGVLSGANVTLIEPVGVVNETPGPVGSRSSGFGEPTASVKTGFLIASGLVMPKFDHSSINDDSLISRL